MSVGEHRREASRVSWFLLSLILGVLLGSAFYTVYLTLEANHRVAALVMEQERAGAESRSIITCGVHDVVENQRTMLLAIRDLIEPDKGPIPPEVQKILDQLDKRVDALTPVDVTGLDCGP